MMPHLDAESRLTLRRFATKLCGSSIIGLYGRPHYFPMVSLVLSLYSICSAVFAITLGEKFLRRDGFNHWDEALWLLLVSTAVRVIYGIY